MHCLLQTAQYNCVRFIHVFYVLKIQFEHCKQPKDPQRDKINLQSIGWGLCGTYTQFASNCIHLLVKAQSAAFRATRHVMAKHRVIKK